MDGLDWKSLGGVKYRAAYAYVCVHASMIHVSTMHVSMTPVLMMHVCIDAYINDS